GRDPAQDKTVWSRRGAERPDDREEASMAGMAVLTVADTIARSFVLAVEKRGNRPAIREKKFGIWQPTSYRQWLQISKDIAYALHAVGFRPGDGAAILSKGVRGGGWAD